MNKTAKSPTVTSRTRLDEQRRQRHHDEEQEVMTDLIASLTNTANEYRKLAGHYMGERQPDMVYSCIKNERNIYVRISRLRRHGLT